MNNLRQIWNKPGGRIALAVALSLLIHTTLLFGPNLIQLNPVEVPLPPLTAKLEPLPAVKAAKMPQPKPHVRHKPATPAAAAPQLPEQQTDTPPIAEETPPPAEAAQEIRQAPPAQEEQPAYPLPKHAQLTFTVYKGTNFSVGEARHRLEIDDDKHYTLQVGMNTTGIASLFKTFEMNQQSRGTVSAAGLRPEEFSEIKVTAKGKQTLNAAFDWQNRQLAFSAGNSVSLPDQAQDILSFLYQFSQMSLEQPTLPMHVSNGRKLESYQIAVGAEEEINTRLGKLRALPLRKIHAPGEEGLEIWLGLEYRLLPVQIRQIDRSGEIAGQMVISEIRVSQD